MRPAANNLLDATNYVYENSILPWNVTGITDLNGTRRWTVTYDTRGRALTSAGPNGADQSTVSYGTVGSTFTRTATNALGKSTVYQFSRVSLYDAALTAVNGQASTNCPSSTRSYAYTNGFISSDTDEEGRVTSYVRESRGLPTSITRGYGTSQAVTTTYTWNPNFVLPTQVVQPGLTTAFTWNSSAQLTQVTQTDTTTQTVPYSTNGQTRTWTYTYTSTGGYLASVDGPLAGSGDTVSYAYNSQGYLQSVTNEVGLVTQFTAWNGRGQPTSMTDPNGVVTNLGYDGVGRLTSITVDPAGINAVTSLTYNAVGDITQVTRPNAAYLQLTWNDARRLTTITDNNGATVNYVRDAMGDVTSRTIKDSGGNTQLAQTATFDELGRFLTFVGAATQTWTYAYDRTSNEVSATDPRSNVHHWAFDSLNRLISETNEDSSVVSLTRNGKDEVTKYTDPRSLATNYVRDGFGEIIQRASPDSGTAVYQYNPQGKVTSITDGNGIVTNLAYDNAGRLLSKQYPASTGENISYTWDSTAGGNNGKGRITEIDDASGSVKWSYDKLGRIVQETKTTAGIAYTIGYAYDSAGNISQVTYPSGRTVSFARDADGRISGVTTTPAGGSGTTLASGITYEPFGPLASLAYGNGLTLTKSFTQDYLLSSVVVHDTTSGTTIVNRGYSRTDNLNLTGIADNVTTGNTESYSYTPSRRLQNGSGAYGALTDSYDGVGNRAQEVLGSTASVYNYPSGSNLLSSISQGGSTVRSLGYDGAGNIVSDSRSGIAYTYAYNNRNRLAQVTVASVVQANYVYDGLERLAIRTTVNMTPSGTTHYVYDLSGRLISEATSSGTIQTEYVWVDGLPLAVFANLDTQTPSQWYVHPDHLNRPVRMTDSTEALVWDAVYWPFGAVYSITGSAVNNLRFPGQYFLLEAGVHYNWYRHYDPTLGRYTQPDPLEFVNGPSLYAYVDGNPVFRTDPTGRFWPEVAGIAIMGGLTWEWFEYFSHPSHLPRPLPPQPVPQNACTFDYPQRAPGAEFRNWTPPVQQSQGPQFPEPPEPPEWPMK
jgi:RHS repeat-associated protein